MERIQFRVFCAPASGIFFSCARSSVTKIPVFPTLVSTATKVKTSVVGTLLSSVKNTSGYSTISKQPWRLPRKLPPLLWLLLSLRKKSWRLPLSLPSLSPSRSRSQKRRSRIWLLLLMVFRLLSLQRSPRSKNLRLLHSITRRCRKVSLSITKSLAMELSVGSTRLESTFVFSSPLVRRCSPWKLHSCKASFL